jgi:hypothetical protein
MIVQILKRLLGILLILYGIAYLYARLTGYDIEYFDLPAFFHSPAMWMALSAICVWSWLPVMQPVAPRQVSMAQEVPRQYMTPQQAEGQAFEMNGQWFIVWNGQYLAWSDELNNWVPYRG